MVWDRQCLEDYERKDDLISKSMSDGGDCRTAPATPGLFNTETHCSTVSKIDKPGLTA